MFSWKRSNPLIGEPKASLEGLKWFEIPSPQTDIFNVSYSKKLNSFTWEDTESCQTNRLTWYSDYKIRNTYQGKGIIKAVYVETSILGSYCFVIRIDTKADTGGHPPRVWEMDQIAIYLLLLVYPLWNAFPMIAVKVFENALKFLLVYSTIENKFAVYKEIDAASMLAAAERAKRLEELLKEHFIQGKTVPSEKELQVKDAMEKKDLYFLLNEVFNMLKADTSKNKLFVTEICFIIMQQLSEGNTPNDFAIRQKISEWERLAIDTRFHEYMEHGIKTDLQKILPNS